MLVTRCTIIAMMAVLVTGSVAGCQSIQDNQKMAAGTVLGGIGGGMLGAQIGKGAGSTAAIITGTLLGSLVGGEIGKSLDRVDRQYMDSAQQRAYYAPLHESITWDNPQSGNRGSCTAVREGTNQRTGEYCRAFNSTFMLEGRQQATTETACRQADGTWRIVSSH